MKMRTWLYWFIVILPSTQGEQQSLDMNMLKRAMKWAQQHCHSAEVNRSYLCLHHGHSVGPHVRHQAQNIHELVVTDVLQEPVQGYERSRPSHASTATHTDMHLIPGSSEGDTQQKQWPCSCNNQIELIWGQAGWFVCGIYRRPLGGHSECTHTHPHPPLALCSSCPPHRLHETPVTPGAGARTAETCSGARDAQRQQGSHLQDSAPQLSTLQSSWHYCSLSPKDKPPRRVCTPGLLP